MLSETAYKLVYMRFSSQPSSRNMAAGILTKKQENQLFFKSFYCKSFMQTKHTMHTYVVVLKVLKTLLFSQTHHLQGFLWFSLFLPFKLFVIGCLRDSYIFCPFRPKDITKIVSRLEIKHFFKDKRRHTF